MISHAMCEQAEEDVLRYITAFDLFKFFASSETGESARRKKREIDEEEENERQRKIAEERLKDRERKI